MIKKRVLKNLYQTQLPRELYAIYLALWMIATTHFTVGENIYDEDWDLLIVLDACRSDTLKEVSDEYSFINRVSTKMSVGSTSLEWFLKTFTEQYEDRIRETKYLTTNGYFGQLESDMTDYFSFVSTSDTHIEQSGIVNKLVNRATINTTNFADITYLYHLEDQNPYGPTVLPDNVTSAAIKAARENKSPKLIVHYMQPHAPYVNGPLDRGEIYNYESSPFAALRCGESHDRVYNAYKDNLRLVLDSVDRLIHNIDIDNVVITADHGELFGEFGLYGHMAGMPHPKLKQVPWVETTATNTREETVEIEKENPGNTEEQTQELLRALGYINK